MLSAGKNIEKPPMGSVTSRFDVAVISQAEKASRTRSDDEFVSKLGGVLQEADESQLWLELLREECGIEPNLTQPLEGESNELMAIMTTMINKTKAKADDRNQGC